MLSTQTKEKFYKNYFQNQANHFGSKDLEKKLNDEVNHFKKEILPCIPSNKKQTILDVGCGYGALLKCLKDEGYENIKGIDASIEQVKTAHQLGLKEVEYAETFTFLESKKQCYDIILCIDLIEHFDKNELIIFLEKIKIALKEGGIAVFRTPNMDAPFGSTYAFGDFTHQTLLNYTSAMQLFRTLEFQSVKVYASVVLFNNPLKTLFRKLFWWKAVLFFKSILMASGKSTKDVIFSPNLIIVAGK